MAVFLSPPKLVLLAVHLAVKADIDSLTTLAARHATILRKELLLRILLTYLPETLRSSNYVSFIEQIESGNFPELGSSEEVDSSVVAGLTDEDAVKKVKKLQLLPLAVPELPEQDVKDATALFLLCRAYKVDEEAGLLDELPGLLSPFLDHSPCVRTLLVSAILPLLRRNCEYYPHEPISYTLLQFQKLTDRVAVNLLLSQTGAREEDLGLVGRDLRGLVGPWLFNPKRWQDRSGSISAPEELKKGDTKEKAHPGWEQLLRWLTNHASKNWKVAVSAIEQWDGPADVDLGGWAETQLSALEQSHLTQTYAQAALASAYLIPEASVEALEGAYSIVSRIATLLDFDPVAPLQTATAILLPLAEQVTNSVASAKNATYLRNDILKPTNVLTCPTKASTVFLQATIMSAYLLTKAGSPCTLRRVGELVLLQDEREQKAEALKLIHALGNNGRKTEDKFWIKARNEILWLRDWGAEEASPDGGFLTQGVFGQLKKEFLEVEILKALLSNTRYNLARSIYEDSPDQPVNKKVLQETIYATAMTAYDNASNPNRTRGGLKKCDDILKAFPKTIEMSLAATKRIEALLQATHALSEFRLVLKQGEPFTPVVLRVHADPVSIIGKILEQNPKGYTRLHDLLDIGDRMVLAGLVTSSSAQGDKTTTTRHKSITALLDAPPPEEETAKQRLTVQRRITAMCIDAALTEDDFETAYSYVVNRLTTTTSKTKPPVTIEDEYSWKAALQAGKYRRTARTIRPTHLGTGSANPEIRHLEQRIECLATALRIAPPATLQEILNAYRRAEEELDSAVKAEQELEDAWDTAGDSMRGSHGSVSGAAHGMPGGFSGHASRATSTFISSHHRPSQSSQTTHSRQQQEEAPMSLFDLSRASVLSAQKNLTALSSLQRVAGGLAGGRSGSQQQQQQARGSMESDSGGAPALNASEEHAKRVRKRDQLKEAALGSLVSGVGWLVGAQAPAAGRGGNHTDDEDDR